VVRQSIVLVMNINDIIKQHAFDKTHRCI